VAGFASTGNRPIYGRSAAGLRFTIYAIIALVLMYFDQRQQWSPRLRYGLQAAAYPVQVAASSPSRVWHWLRDATTSRRELRIENEQLKSSQQTLQIAQLRLQALEAENQQLRGLKAAVPALISKSLLAEVISVDTTLLRQRLIINKGARDGVQLNQVALDGNGILGQVSSLGPWSAEIILVTDPEHALPVQFTRNQLRSVAVGSGRVDQLLLPYLAANADVKAGDLLVSSGLGGVFPAGLPVARVVGVGKAPNQLLAQITATPVAHADRAREVVLIYMNTGNSAAPVTDPLILAPGAPAASGAAAP
jgi:rod shape-determining protein MreC